jgi:hypothetical protein
MSLMKYYKPLNKFKADNSKLEVIKILPDDTEIQETDFKYNNLIPDDWSHGLLYLFVMKYLDY